MNQNDRHENGLLTEEHATHTESRPDITPYAMSFIQCKAKQLVGKCGIHACDRDDIEQELYLNLLERLPKFDESKAKLTTFIQRVVEKKAAMLLRERCSEKNTAYRTAQSLDEVVAQDELGNSMTLADTLCDFRNLSPELAAEVQLTIESLPELHQRVARMLLNHCSITAIAAELGMSRTTLRDGIVRDIRHAFEFLKNSDFSSPK